MATAEAWVFDFNFWIFVLFIPCFLEARVLNWLARSLSFQPSFCETQFVCLSKVVPDSLGFAVFLCFNKMEKKDILELKHEITFVKFSLRLREKGRRKKVNWILFKSWKPGCSDRYVIAACFCLVSLTWELNRTNLPTNMDLAWTGTRGFGFPVCVWFVYNLHVSFGTPIYRVPGEIQARTLVESSTWDYYLIECSAPRGNRLLLTNCFLVCLNASKW